MREKPEFRRSAPRRIAPRDTPDGERSGGATAGRRSGRWTAGIGTIAAIGAVLATAGTSSAQLRPLEPVPWSALTADAVVSWRAGAGSYRGQRASLAGTEGRLAELGRFSVLWRTGRVALQAAGTMLHVYEDRATFAAPVGGARAPDGRLRVDAGDYRVSTMLLLTEVESNPSVVMRFGTRLPTTDNRVGLERDRTDFFASVGAYARRGRLRLAAEGGLGIHGTRDPGFEQSDVFVYSARLSYAGQRIAPSATFVGQADGLDGWTLRGNEDLREVRVGIRAGRRPWVGIELVRGLTEFSPELGMRISTGMVLGAPQRSRARRPRAVRCGCRRYANRREPRR